MQFGEKKRNKPMYISIFVIIIIGVGLLFFIKPMGDKYPFEILLYKTSPITKVNYRILSQGKGPKIKDQELATMNFSYRKIKHRNYIFNTKKSKMTWPFQYKKETLKDKNKFSAILTEVVGMLKKDGVSRVIITPKQMFSPQENAKEQKEFLKKNNLAKDSKLVLEIVIKDLMSKEKYEEDQKTKIKEFTDKLQKKIETRFKEDVKMIETKIKDKGLSSKTHKLLEKGIDTGIRYYTISEGNIKLKRGDVVKIKYKIHTFNKQNTRISYDTLAIVGDPKIEKIPKFGLLLPKLKIGQKIKLWIPTKYSKSMGGYMDKSNILCYEIEKINFPKLKKE